MPKINLSVRSDRIFGKYLPSVYIKRVIVDYEQSDSGLVETTTKFDMELSINFTKDPSFGALALADVRDWMTEGLDGLYLYTWLSPHKTLNARLEQKKLNLLDLFEAYDTPTVETFSSDHYMFDHVIGRMKEVWTTKEIDFFGAGGGTTGGLDSMPAGYIGEDGWIEGIDGLTGFYYLTSPDNMLSSTNTPGSLFHTLFYGNNPAGPWGTGSGDLPSIIDYTADDPFFNGSRQLAVILNGLDHDLAFPDRILDGKWETATGIEGGQSFMNRYLATYLDEAIGADTDGAHTFQHKIKLIDLLDAGDGEPGELILREVYDQDGKEIIQITGINLKFTYDESATDIKLEAIDDLFVISTIGLDVDESEVQHRKGIDRSSAPRGIFNNYFGGITYESVLKNNRVDDSFTEIFVDDTGVPYDGIPIQALNGKYYAEEPISRGEIVSKLNTIATTYKSKYSTDSNLKANVRNLQYILSRYQDSTNLFSELKRFQKTYTLKSQATASGKFYAGVINALVSYSKRVMKQEELNKKLIMNAVVMDVRQTKFLSEAYTPPYSLGDAPSTGKMQTYDIEVEIPGASPTGDGPYTVTREAGALTSMIAEEVSDNYIPRKWISISRATKMSDTNAHAMSSNLSDYAELYADLQRDIDPELALGEASDGSTRPESYWNELRELTIENIIHNNPEREMIEDIIGTREYGPGMDADLVTRNSGHFFFDWEKAMHQQSQASHVVMLSAVHRFLGLQMPYKNFRVTGVRLIRNEATLVRGTSGDAGPAADSPQVFIAQSMVMDDTVDYPKTKESIYTAVSNFTIDSSGFTDLTMGEALNSSIGSGYGFAEVEIWDSTAMESKTKSRSTLSFVNFDVAATSKSHRLEGYGRFTPYGEDEALPMGYKIRDGYRLMCFRFRDWMDDDIAYYNTVYGEDEDRNDALISSNHYDDPCSQYTMQVVVEDRTLEFLIEKVYALIISAYADLKEYVLYAEELCSYNNITNEFNQFFIDAINARYPEPENKAWIKAAFILNSCRAIFFSEFGDEPNGQEEAIIRKSVDLVNKMSPERGRLENLRAFLSDYRRFIMLFDPSHMDLDVPLDVYPTPHIYDRIMEVTGHTETDPPPSIADFAHFSKEHHFVNSISIDQPIYGEQFLDAYKESDITLPRTSMDAGGGPSSEGEDTRDEGDGGGSFYDDDWGLDE